MLAWAKIDAYRGWPLWLIAAVIGYATFLFMPQVLGDSDTYLHITAGEWILDHRAVPHTDPFSFIRAGAPWVAHEWLAECIMALCYRLAGWNGEVILFGLITGLTLILLVRHISRWLDALPATLMVIVIMACISPSLLARPHIMALLTLEIWVLGLLHARSLATAPSPRLLLIMILWANIHGSFIFGVLLVGPLGLEAIMAAGKGWKRAVFQWGIFFAGALLAAMITPQGVQGLLFPFQLVHTKPLDAIVEWRSTDFSSMQPIEIALMALLYVCLSRGVRVPLLRLLLVLGLLHLALEHTRFQMIAAMVGGLVLAEPLGAGLGATFTPLPQNYTRARFITLGVFVLLLTAARIAHPLVRVDNATSPVSAIEHVPPELAVKPVLNEFAFGGYLIFNNIHPFVDGRVDMYGNDFMAEYMQMMSPDPALLERTLSRWHIAWVILAANSPVISTMDDMPGWHRLYSDTIAVIYVRNVTP